MGDWQQLHVFESEGFKNVHSGQGFHRAPFTASSITKGVPQASHASAFSPLSIVHTGHLREMESFRDREEGATVDVEHRSGLHSGFSEGSKGSWHPWQTLVPASLTIMQLWHSIPSSSIVCSPSKFDEQTEHIDDPSSLRKVQEVHLFKFTITFLFLASGSCSSSSSVKSITSYPFSIASCFESKSGTNFERCLQCLPQHPPMVLHVVYFFTA
mmetsp:Transcript_11495/g.15012  ORF Transcript_11495/g.15012 Transcript_11495/m.15012 type:complete len:213 (-) Transcript_11495:23-661(-)